jgi:hypothetical protein
MTKRSAIVHVGLEKTGSTAIQRWLETNSQELIAEGVLIPRSLGFPNHTKLVSACLDDGAVDHIKAYHLFASGHSEARFRESVFSALDREIASAGATWRSLVITSELISSRLSSETEIHRLFDHLAGYVDDIHILIFLRRQDQLALSRFSSILRSGHSEFDRLFVDYSPRNFRSLPIDRTVSDDVFFYDFDAILSRFARVPGAKLHVHAYGRTSPLDALMRLLALEPSSQGHVRERHNTALSAEAQFVLACLNAQHPVQFPSGMRNEGFRRLQRRIEHEVKGAPRTIGRDEARQFLLRYHQINQRVADQYAGGQALFSDDFDRYPTTVDYSHFPDVLNPVVQHYQSLAGALPSHEPLRQHWTYRLRRLKSSTVELFRWRG